MKLSTHIYFQYMEGGLGVLVNQTLWQVGKDKAWTETCPLSRAVFAAEFSGFIIYNVFETVCLFCSFLQFY